MFYTVLQSKRDHWALRARGRAFAEAETSSGTGMRPLRLNAMT